MRYVWEKFLHRVNVYAPGTDHHWAYTALVVPVFNDTLAFTKVPRPKPKCLFATLGPPEPSRICSEKDTGVRHVRWPTFNLADVFVVVGVGLLLLTDDRPLRVVAGDAKSAS